MFLYMSMHIHLLFKKNPWHWMKYFKGHYWLFESCSLYSVIFSSRNLKHYSSPDICLSKISFQADRSIDSFAQQIKLRTQVWVNQEGDRKNLPLPPTFSQVMLCYWTGKVTISKQYIGGNSQHLTRAFIGGNLETMIHEGMKGGFIWMLTHY